MKEKKSHCVSCGDPDHGDCLTPDGLCFGCDVHETRELYLGHEHPGVVELLERWGITHSLAKAGKDAS